MSAQDEQENDCQANGNTDRGLIDFPCLEKGGALNRWSSTLTRGHDFPGAQAMLYGAGVPNRETLKTAPHVGIATVWWEGKPCNTHILDLGKIVKSQVEAQGVLGWQFNTIGVSDTITMGGEGMRFSLQTREIIADSIESVTCAQHHDANSSIPGCDKNMPGAIIAAARHNRPFIMVYGETIRKGYSSLLERQIDVSTYYEVAGALNYGRLFAESDPSKSPIEVLEDVIQACPSAGPCGGMYTANTMAIAIKAMGLTLPGSSSYPSNSPEKARECSRTVGAIKIAMEKDIRPLDLLSWAAFENALVLTVILGDSTNGVLHLMAIANTAGVALSLDEVHRVSNRTPVLTGLAPSGTYHMEDLYHIGGTPSVLKMLIGAGLIDGSVMTITGRVLKENVADWPALPVDQQIIRPLTSPKKPTGHFRVLKGNLAPVGAVAKISGKEGLQFTGKARIFNKEHEPDSALSNGQIPYDEKLVLIVRYEGPCGGPGMPEQLRASAALMGAGLTNAALMTDGRYSGASHGFIVDHVVPEAAMGGPIALVKDGDVITIDAINNSIDVGLDQAELERRRRLWKRPHPAITRGVLAKYARLVGDASHGAVTDLPLRASDGSWF